MPGDHRGESRELPADGLYVRFLERNVEQRARVAVGGGTAGHRASFSCGGVPVHETKLIVRGDGSADAPFGHLHREPCGVFGQLALRNPQAHLDLPPRLLQQPRSVDHGLFGDARLFRIDVFGALPPERLELARQRGHLLFDFRKLRRRRGAHLRRGHEILADLGAAGCEIRGDRGAQKVHENADQHREIEQAGDHRHHGIGVMFFCLSVLGRGRRMRGLEPPAAPAAAASPARVPAPTPARPRQEPGQSGDRLSG